MPVSPVLACTLGVQSIQETLDFYRAAFGYEQLGCGPVDAQGGAVWRVPHPERARWSLIGLPDKPLGRLCLLEFDRPGVRIWGSYERRQDLGHFALNFRALDLDAVWKRMMALGASEKFAPAHWQLSGQFGTWDSQCIDANGVILDVYQLDPGGEEMWGPQREDVSELSTVAVHVSDSDLSRAFYAGLGFDVIYDEILPGLETILGLPPGVVLRNVNLIQPDVSFNARIELAEYVGQPGLPVGRRADPPNIGIGGIALWADDLDEVVRVVEASGGRTMGDTVRDWASPYGRVNARVVAGPDGEAIELLERIDS